MKIYFNKEARKIEHKAEWVDDVVVEGVYMLLPAGRHIYQLCFLPDENSLVRVLDPETMRRNTAFPDQPFEKLNIMFKLSEDYVVMGSEENKIFMISTVTNKVVQTITLEP